MITISKARLALLVCIFFLLYLLGIANLYRLQIHHHHFFNDLARQQYQVTVVQTPDRALLYDRNNNPLALNKDSLAAFITPNNLHDSQSLKKFLKDHFPLALERLKKHSQDLFMYIKRRLTDDEFNLIQQAGLADIYLLQDPSRFYPVPSLGHTIGITDSDNNGISGIELMYNKQLSGQKTTCVLEKDARSHAFYFKKNLIAQGHEGSLLTLTIDSDLQFLTYEELKDDVELLGAQEGCALIMNATTGEILAMACYPDFDPNSPTQEVSWKTKNRIVTECYEFGSVMKIFPALAALELGLVQPEEIIDCENKKETYVNGMKVTTWKACGLLPYTEVIRNSNNIGTSKVALRVGKQLYDHYKKAGFMQPTGINFLGEQIGFITPPQSWSKATPLSLSFGYEISATLLQVARAFTLLCNDGVLATPHLFTNFKPSDTPKQQIYSSKTVNALRDIINFDNPTSSSYYGKIPGCTIMGKTGSAYLLTNGTYDHSRSLYTFVGIIEKNDYKRIIAVYVREPKPIGKKVYAATVAVPLFKKIALSMLIHDKIV